MSDEERLLRYSYAGSQVDQMLAAGPLQTEYRFEKPLVRLLNELAKRPRFKHVYLDGNALRLELDSKAGSTGRQSAAE